MKPTSIRAGAAGREREGGGERERATGDAITMSRRNYSSSDGTQCQIVSLFLAHAKLCFGGCARACVRKGMRGRFVRAKFVFGGKKEKAQRPGWRAHQTHGRSLFRATPRVTREVVGPQFIPRLTLVLVRDIVFVVTAVFRLRLPFWGIGGRGSFLGVVGVGEIYNGCGTRSGSVFL